MVERKGKGRRQFPKEFKEEICRLYAGGEYSQKELSEKFEVDASLLSKWLRAERTEGKDAFRGQGNRTELEAENQRLKEENRQLKAERDILKKATAYFAKHLV